MKAEQSPYFLHSVSKKSPHLATDELLQQYINEPMYSDYFVNLSPYINDSGVSVPLHFSLHRAYILFRTLGLRHMTVVNHTNQARWMISKRVVRLQCEPFPLWPQRMKFSHPFATTKFSSQ